MKKTILVFVLLFTTVIQSQSPRATWTQGGVTSTAQAQAFEYKIYYTSPTGTQSNAVLTGTTCTGTAPNVNCGAPVPAQFNIITGARFELTARDAASGSAESAKSIPFSQGADVPTGLTVIR